MIFEAINVEANPAALEDLERFGITLVPALVDGDRAFQGWNPSSLAEFVGVPYFEPEPLSPLELSRRLDRILEAAQRAMRRVPAEQVNRKIPGRDRTVRELGFHLFRLGLAYRDGLQQGRYPESWLLETPPAELADGAAIADYGGLVRDALADWWKSPNAHESAIDTYYGSQTAHELFERTVWHAAQHLRQLYALLGHMGVSLQDPLGDDDFLGLPLPDALW